jgi:hypothetical protein
MKGAKTTCESCCREKDTSIAAKKHFSIIETRPKLKDEFVEKHACC